MAYSLITPIVGKPQAGYLNVVSLTADAQLGTVVGAVDNYYGYAEFMYVQFAASTSIPRGTVVTLSGFGGTANYTAGIAATTANTGRPIGVCLNDVASNAAIQYGWIQISGNAIVKTTASVAAGTTFGIDASTAGSVAASSAGRQVLNAVSVGASTLTVVKTAKLTNGQPYITVSNVDGWVPGLTVTGTGVSGTITAVDPDSRTVTLSANNTAGGSSSVTATYTGYIVAQIQRPFLQGRID